MKSATTNDKTNVSTVNSVTASSEKICGFSIKLQSTGHHRALIRTVSLKREKNTLLERYQKKRIWISLSDELSEIYLDEDGNLMFEGYFDEVVKTPASTQEVTASTRITKNFFRDLSNFQMMKLKKIMTQLVKI